MSNYFELEKKARNELQKAKNSLYVTLDIVKDNRVVKTILERITKSSKYALESLLEFERNKKHIVAYPKNFLIMIKTYEDKVQDRRKFDPKFLSYLKELTKLKRHIEISTINFKQDEEYVFVTDDYEKESLYFELINKYYNLTDEFILKIREVIYEDG